MHRRSLRYGLVVLLFAAAAGAAGFAWTVDRQLAALIAREHAAAARFDALVPAIARFDAAQQTFDPSRESEAEWFVRVERLLTRIQSDGAALHGLAASEAAAQTFSDVTARVVSAVKRAEENFRAGHELMAADLVQDEGRPGAEAMRAAVLEWRAAEASAADAVRARLFQQLWSVLGGTAALWGIGVLLLAPRKAPAPLAPSSPALVVEPAADAPLSLSVREVPVPDLPVPAPTPYLPLDPAAALCTDIARADTAAALDALVDRAASMLGAAGIVIWLKGPQDELVPAVVHGYGPEAHARIGGLPLSDANLTTRAWHSGVLQSAAGEGRGRAALAAPLFQGAQPTGVFAVELASGSESSAEIRALTGILAAQFAGAVTPRIETAAVADQPLEATGS